MRYIFFIYSLVLLFSCSSNKQTISLNKRYHKAYLTIVKSNEKSAIEVVAKVLPTPTKTAKTETGKTMFDLTSEGQKAFIKASNIFFKHDIDKFNNEINQKFLTEKEDNTIIDITKKNLRLLFSISQKDLYIQFPDSSSLGDRIEYLKINLKLDDTSKFKFSDWNLFTTKYGQYNITSQTLTNAQSINLSPSIPLSNGLLTLGSYSKSNQLVESDSLKRRFILLNGILQDDSIIIEQTGTAEINLTGNISTDLTLDLKTQNYSKDIMCNFSFDKLTYKNEFSNPKDVVINKKYIIYPQILTNDSATLVCTYAFRHIRKGDETQNENDDEIEYFHGTTKPIKVCILKQEDAKPKQWGILINNNSLMALDTINKSSLELLFSSYKEAEDFLIWLKYTNRYFIKTNNMTSEIIINRFKFCINNVLIDSKTSLDEAKIIVHK